MRSCNARLYHSDLHLMNGKWKDAIPLDLPKIPGHENAGWVEEAGDTVPPGLFNKGELVAIFGEWGYCIRTFCKREDEQLCEVPSWLGPSQRYGGYSEYILVPAYRFLVKLPRNSNLNPEELAPLTNAGVTVYSVKKVRSMLGPGTSIAVFGMGGPGSYGIRYAKVLASNSKVIAIDRSDKKLSLAENLGADRTINSATCKNIREEVFQLTD